MTNFFKELFDYNHHFNQQLATIFIEQVDKTLKKSVVWFNHILNAHHIWNSRILSEPTTTGPWDMHTHGELKEMDRVNYAKSVQALDTIELHRPVHYTTSKGDNFTNIIRDILFHIVNHSTYHRGQIAAEFRQQGIEPLITDYIFYKRQG
jgi:uncharacterized damage-inducible protein DinB